MSKSSHITTGDGAGEARRAQRRRQRMNPISQNLLSISQPTTA